MHMPTWAGKRKHGVLEAMVTVAVMAAATAVEVAVEAVAVAGKNSRRLCEPHRGLISATRVGRISFHP